MPNHVTSRCVITGPADDVARFRAECIRQMTDEGGRTYVSLDFNAVIPMPEILQSAVEGGYGETGARLLLTANSNPFGPAIGFYERELTEWKTAHPTVRSMPELASAVLAAEPKYAEEGKARLKAIAETGYGSWYPWSIEHWGTKWNAYSFEDVGEDPHTIKFQTAWSFPIPVFNALAERFPTLTFDCVTYDEGASFAGEGAFNPGPGQKPFEIGDATDRLYELVYGEPPERDEEDEDEEADEPVH